MAIDPHRQTQPKNLQMTFFDKLKKRWAFEANEQSDRANSFRERLLNEGIPIFKKYNIKKVYLFGSLAAGRCEENSDVDLFVSPLSSENYWQFRFELEELIQLPIDLYTNDDDRVFVKKIIERGVKIYGL